MLSLLNSFSSPLPNGFKQASQPRFGMKEERNAKAPRLEGSRPKSAEKKAADKNDRFEPTAKPVAHGEASKRPGAVSKRPVSQYQSAIKSGQPTRGMSLPEHWKGLDAVKTLDELPNPFELNEASRSTPALMPGASGLQGLLSPFNHPAVGFAHKILAASTVRFPPPGQKAEKSGTTAAKSLHAVQGASPASQDELMDILNIPYPFQLVTGQQVRSDLAPKEAAKTLKAAKTIAVGDMHGSYQKLVETLVAADLIEMPPRVARQFYQLANSSANRPKSPDELLSLYQDMSKVIPLMRWKGGDRQLILIGDMLSDRGPMDAITLDIVKHLSDQAPNSFVRIASNHDHNVLEFLYSGISFIASNADASMIRSVSLAPQLPGGLANLEDKYLDYLLQSKLMHFDPKSKTLYAHAPISPKELVRVRNLMDLGLFNEGFTRPEKLAPHLLEVKNAEDVEVFVDGANQAYKDYVVLHQKKLQAERDAKATENVHADLGKQPLDLIRGKIEGYLFGAGRGFLWTRNPLTEKSQIPFYQAGVKTLVHGHDRESAFASGFSAFRGEDKAQGYTVVNLDQDVRKEGFEDAPDAQHSLFILPDKAE